MGPVVGDISGSLYGFGDNTAGPVWRNTVSPSSPLGGFEDKTNFPDGENLFSPVGFSSALQSVPLWLLSHIFSPVVAYNLFNISGFVLTALIMYGFILYITKNHWVAWLAGFAASYAPYYQVKVGGHPSYAFSGFFVLAIWIFIALINRPTVAKAISLGLLVALTFYFDPYFVLYQLLTCLAMLGGWLYVSKGTKRAVVVRQFKLLLLAVLTSLIFLTPLIGVYVSSRSTIQKQVTSVRGNVVAEATACSNYPHEYLLPFVLHPMARVTGLESSVKRAEIKLKDNFSCGIGEDTVGISITMLVVILITSIVVLWEVSNKRRVNQYSKNSNIVIVIAGILLLLGLMFGLPPKIFFGIPTPTKVLLDLTTTWRTLARSYMLVNTGLVILMSVALTFYARNIRISKRIKVIGYLIILILIFIEYQAFTPFKGNQMSSFSLNKDVPEVYVDLRGRKDLDEIVEYPLESYGESDAPSYYLSMQLLHGKRILNSPSPTSSLEDLRRSVRNITDPQTIPVLRALGIDAIVVHGVTEKDLNYLKKYEVSQIFGQPRFTLTSHTGVISKDQSVIVDINKQPTTKAATIGILEKGFYRNLGIIKGPFDWAYEAVDGATIRVKEVGRGGLTDLKNNQPYCFMVRNSAPGDTQELKAVVDGVEMGSVAVTGAYTPVQYVAGKSIILKSDKKLNMQITSLGCLQ